MVSQPGSKSRACWVRGDFASGFVFRLPYQYCGSQVVEKASKEINCASKCDREEQNANGQPKEPTNTLKLAFSFSHASTSYLDCVTASKSVSGIAAGGTGNDFLAGLTLCSFHSYSAGGVVSTTRHQSADGCLCPLRG